MCGGNGQRLLAWAPSIADTLWLTVGDQKNKVYCCRDTNSPSILRVQLNDLNFKEGSGARKRQIDGNPDVASGQTKNFKPAPLFEFPVPHD